MVYTSKPPFGTQLDMNHPLNVGLSALWVFNEGTGNKVYDLSNNGNTGTLTNMAFPSTSISGWNPGKTGQPSISFDGVDDYINIGQPTSLLSTGAMTIESLVKVDNLNDDWRIISKQGGSTVRSWNLAVSSTGDYFQISSDGTLIQFVQSSITRVVNKWTQVVAVYLPSIALRIYNDGVLTGENTTNIPSSQYINNGLDINIGRMSSNMLYMPGSIDQVRIWNRALSSSEIMSLYNNPYSMFLEPTPCNPPQCNFIIAEC